MEITSFKPSTDRKSINLIIENASAITSILLFTNKTYKDYNKAIDLTAKLTASATENLSITLGDLKQSYLDGLYFIEVQDPTDICTAITLDSTRYRECVLNKMSNMDTCDECIKEVAGEILAAETLLSALTIATSDGYPEQAFNHVSALDRICSENCKNCGGLSNVTTVTYFTSNSN